jgi:predicted nucleic-acid-binding Zn-ribbon protein
MSYALKCSKCGGRVFLDVAFSQNTYYELFCINCGKRPMIRKSSMRGQWLSTLVGTT